MIRRERYLKRIIPFMDRKIIKVLTGLRRSGKSVLLEQIRDELLARGTLPDRIHLMNFENMKLSHLTSGKALHDELERLSSAGSGRLYVLLDEVQMVTDWERCVNSLLATCDIDITITGSNAALLSGDLATLIAGRTVEFRIYPFSYAEHIQVEREYFPDCTPAESFQRYLRFGGMPFLGVLGYDEAQCRQYLQDIFTSIVIKDIMRLNHFRDVDLLEKVILYMVGNIGQPFSANSLSRFLKSERRTVSIDTVLNYVKACSEAYLFHRVPRQDAIGKQLLQVAEKQYLADHGLREAIYGHNERDIQLVLENIIYMELIRRGWKITAGRLQDAEIDFICERAGERLYVQAAYLLATTETIEREFGVLRKIPDNYPKVVVSMDAFDLGRDGILHRNVIDFLLGSEWE